MESRQLYRQILRQSLRFDSYYFRTYAVRRARDAFRANRDLTDPAAIQAAVDQGKKDLTMLSRQGLISTLYTMPHLVVER